MSESGDDLDDQRVPDELIGSARALVEFALTSLLSPALLVDGGGYVEAASPAAFVALGVSPDRIVGHPISDVAGVTTDLLAELALDPRQLRSATGSDGGRQIRATSLADTRSDGGWLVELRTDDAVDRNLDETTQRLDELVEDLLERHERLNRYVGVISHDLQAPARRLLSLVELLRGDLPDIAADAGERLNAVEESAHHLLRLTSELLAFSRLGSTPMPVVRVDTGAVLERTLDQLAIALEEADATVVVDGPLPAVRADATFLGVVFQHLVQNAIDHRGDGPVRVTICADEVTGQAGEPLVRLHVTDDGPGIPTELRDAVFRPFRRLAPQTSHTGLGLTTVADIVDRFDGSVAITDGGVGEGTTFTLTLLAARGT